MLEKDLRSFLHCLVRKKGASSHHKNTHTHTHTYLYIYIHTHAYKCANAHKTAAFHSVWKKMHQNRQREGEQKQLSSSCAVVQSRRQRDNSGLCVGTAPPQISDSNSVSLHRQTNNRAWQQNRGVPDRCLFRKDRVQAVSERLLVSLSLPYTQWNCGST